MMGAIFLTTWNILHPAPGVEDVFRQLSSRLA